MSLPTLLDDDSAPGLVRQGLVGGWLFQARNLLLWPEALDNAAWTKDAGVTVDANVDGVADRINLPATLGAAISQAITAFAGNYTFSVYLRVAAGTGTVTLDIDGTTQLCNLTTTWQRFSATKTLAAGTKTVKIKNDEASAKSVLANYAQVNEGSAALPYDAHAFSPSLQLVEDISGNGNHMRRGSASGSDDNDYALTLAGGNFDGLNDYGNVVLADSYFLGAYTLLVVSNITEVTNARHFLGKHIGAGGSNNPFDFRTGAGPVVGVIRAHATDSRYWTGPAPVAGVWRMYGVSIANGLLETAPIFYIGETGSVGTSGGAATGQVTGSSADLRMGVRDDWAVPMLGVTAAALVYSRALSATEIQRNYRWLRSYLTAFGVTLP